MAEQAKATLQRSVPWRRGLAWWIVGLEGLLLLAAGIYVVAAPDDAKDAVRVIIGVFLLANAVSTAMAGLRAAALSNPGTPYRMLAAGSGLTVGIICRSSAVVRKHHRQRGSGDPRPRAPRVRRIGLAAAFATRATGGMRRGALVISAVMILFAIVLFYNVRNETLDMRWFGYAALAAGVLLCGYAFALYKALQVTPEVSATDPSQATVATDPAPVTAEAPQPPAPLSPEPASAELEPFDVAVGPRDSGFDGNMIVSCRGVRAPRGSGSS